ncbi:MAG: hypothetical protein AAGA72_10795 [Pseudomonadota bacterium]
MRKAHICLALPALSLISLGACGAGPSAPDRGMQNLGVNQIGAGASLSAACAGCHSQSSGAIVSLADYGEARLIERLNWYKTDVSGTTVMHRLARGYTEADIALIARHLSTQEPPE